MSRKYNIIITSNIYNFRYVKSGLSKFLTITLRIAIYFPSYFYVTFARPVIIVIATQSVRNNLSAMWQLLLPWPDNWTRTLMTRVRGQIIPRVYVTFTAVGNLTLSALFCNGRSSGSNFRS